MKALLYRLYDSGLRDFCYPVEQRGHALMRSLSRRSVAVPGHRTLTESAPQL
jgi:hypothetical protein